MEAKVELKCVSTRKGNTSETRRIIRLRKIYIHDVLVHLRTLVI